MLTWIKRAALKYFLRGLAAELSRDSAARNAARCYLADGSVSAILTSYTLLTPDPGDDSIAQIWNTVITSAADQPLTTVAGQVTIPMIDLPLRDVLDELASGILA